MNSNDAVQFDIYRENWKHVTGNGYVNRDQNIAMFPSREDNLIKLTQE